LKLALQRVVVAFLARRGSWTPLFRDGQALRLQILAVLLEFGSLGRLARGD